MFFLKSAILLLIVICLNILLILHMWLAILKLKYNLILLKKKFSAKITNLLKLKECIYRDFMLHSYLYQKVISKQVKFSCWTAVTLP